MEGELCLLSKNVIIQSITVTTYRRQRVINLFLDRQGRHMSCSKNNIPGRHWDSFNKRHQASLTQFLAANKNRVCARVSPEVIRKYLENLRISIDNVSPSNWFNYD